MPRSALLALLLALAIAGCGAANDSAGDFEGAQQDVARTVEDLEEAAQEDEPERICGALLARDLVQEIGDDCAQEIQRALDQTDTFSLTVEDVRVSGDSATADVDTGLDEERIQRVELVREGDAWKVSGLPGG